MGLAQHAEWAYTSRYEIDSDGEIHSAKTVNNVRFRHRRLRQKWQAKGTEASRRRLKQRCCGDKHSSPGVRNCARRLGY